MTLKYGGVQRNLAVQRAELIVGCPDWSGNTVFSVQELQSLRLDWEFIEQEARQRQNTAVRCQGVGAAAQHLLKLAA